MGVINDILKKLKTFIHDLRRNLGLLIIITIIWVMLLFGILFLKVYVGPLTPDPAIYGLLDPALITLLTATVQVMLGAGYFGIWLYLWYRLIRMYFWRTIQKYYPAEEETQ